MDFIPIVETPKIDYSIPPKIIDGLIEFCTNKGKKIYKADFIFIRNCDFNYPNECIHTIDIEVYNLDNKDSLLLYTKYEKLTFNNVKYEDIQSLGYLKHMTYKIYKTKDCCKLTQKIDN
jgi:hypothetical protein